MNAHELWLRVTTTRSRSSRFARSVHSERGASAVEYGLMIAGIAALIAIVVFAFGDNIRDILFDGTCQKIVEGRGSGDCV